MEEDKKVLTVVSCHGHSLRSLKCNATRRVKTRCVDLALLQPVAVLFPLFLPFSRDVKTVHVGGQAETIQYINAHM